MMPRSGALAVVLLALWPALARAQERTIYSSLPLQGASAEQSRDVVRGARLALSQAGGRAGGIPIRYVSLDDSTRQAGTWTPERVQRNASRAVGDASTIAYLGEFNSGASALSIPVLNEAGIAQISPSNTATGLTKDGPGADRGEPDKYLPTGRRNYVRIVPQDQVQAAALARLAQELGAKRVYLVDDREIYGDGIADGVRAALAARGITLAGRSRLGRNGRNATSLARRVRSTRADAMIFGGITANGAPRLFDAVHRRNRRIALLGSDGVAEAGFTREISRSTRRRTRVAVATLPPAQLPPSAQAVRSALRAQGGGEPDPYAYYGYEAMSLALDAIARAGARGGEKAAVVEQLFATRDRESVLGRYSIDANGDTTLSTYGVYRPDARGALRFDRTVDSAAR